MTSKYAIQKETLIHDHALLIAERAELEDYLNQPVLYTKAGRLFTPEEYHSARKPSLQRKLDISKQLEQIRSQLRAIADKQEIEADTITIVTRMHLLECLERLSNEAKARLRDPSATIDGEWFHASDIINRITEYCAIPLIDHVTDTTQQPAATCAITGEPLGRPSEPYRISRHGPFPTKGNTLAATAARPVEIATLTFPSEHSTSDSARAGSTATSEVAPAVLVTVKTKRKAATRKTIAGRKAARKSKPKPKASPKAIPALSH